MILFINKINAGTLDRVEESTNHKIGFCFEKFYIYTYIDCAGDSIGTIDLKLGTGKFI
jgi:hypothetical protein